MSTPPSKNALIVSWLLSGLAILFLLMDAGMKLVPLDVVLETSGQLGWPADATTARTLGIILAICTILYAVPLTSVFGAVLLTGYLGGAVATQMRIGNPLFSHILFGLYLGLFVWGSLYLRNTALRALFPLKARN